MIELSISFFMMIGLNDEQERNCEQGRPTMGQHPIDQFKL